MRSSRSGAQWISNTKMWILLEVAVSRIDSFQIETELNRCISLSLCLSLFERLMKNASGKSWHEMGDVSCCNASPAALSYYLLPAFLWIIYFCSLFLSLSLSLFSLCFCFALYFFCYHLRWNFVSFARKTAQFRPQCSLRRLGQLVGPNAACKLRLTFVFTPLLLLLYLFLLPS